MLGLEILVKSMGLDPDEIKKQVESLLVGMHNASVEIERQGKLLNAIAEKLGIETQPLLENKNGTDE